MGIASKCVHKPFKKEWIDDIGWDDERYADNDRDVQTWFAADPTIM